MTMNKKTNRLVEPTYSLDGFSETYYNITYSDLVCLSFILSAHSPSEKFQVNEYKKLLSSSAKQYYKDYCVQCNQIKQKSMMAKGMTAKVSRTKKPRTTFRCYAYRESDINRLNYLRQISQINNKLRVAQQDMYVLEDVQSLMDELLPVE